MDILFVVTLLACVAKENSVLGKLYCYTCNFSNGTKCENSPSNFQKIRCNNNLNMKMLCFERDFQTREGRVVSQRGCLRNDFYKNGWLCPNYASSCKQKTCSSHLCNGPTCNSGKKIQYTIWLLVINSLSILVFILKENC